MNPPTPQSHSPTGSKDSLPSVELHIERLVIDGLPFGSLEAARFRSALERELGRLLDGAEGSNWNSTALAGVTAAPIRLTPGGSPAIWGRQTAAALIGCLPASPPVKQQTRERIPGVAGSQQRTTLPASGRRS